MPQTIKSTLYPVHELNFLPSNPTLPLFPPPKLGFWYSNRHIHKSGKRAIDERKERVKNTVKKGQHQKVESICTPSSSIPSMQVTFLFHSIHPSLRVRIYSSSPPVRARPSLEFKKWLLYHRHQISLCPIQTIYNSGFRQGLTASQPTQPSSRKQPSAEQRKGRNRGNGARC